MFGRIPEESNTRHLSTFGQMHNRAKSEETRLWIGLLNRGIFFVCFFFNFIFFEIFARLCVCVCVCSCTEMYTLMRVWPRIRPHPNLQRRRQKGFISCPWAQDKTVRSEVSGSRRSLQMKVSHSLSLFSLSGHGAALAVSPPLFIRFTAGEPPPRRDFRPTAP